MIVLLAIYVMIFGDMKLKLTTVSSLSVSVAPDTHTWPGVAIFLQNLLIFFSSIVYKIGRTEESWN